MKPKNPGEKKSEEKERRVLVFSESVFKDGN